METEVVHDEKNELHVLFKDADIGLVQLLVEKLLQEKDVEFAAVDYDHPLKHNPVLKIKAKSSPKKLLANAAGHALKDVQDFKKALTGKTSSKK